MASAVVPLLAGTLVTVTASAAVAANPPTGEVLVSQLPWSSETNGYGPVERDMSNGQAAAGDGRTLKVAGVEYEHGIGMHATGSISVALGGNCTTFTTLVGIDDEVFETPGEPAGSGSVIFRIIGDGSVLAETPVVRNADGAVSLEADVTGVDTLTLVADEATEGKNFDHADWLAPTLQCADTVPQPPVDVDSWSIAGPAGSELTAELVLDSLGRIRLEIARAGAPVLTAGQLGLLAAEGDFRDGLAFVARHDRTVTGDYTMTTGKETERSYTFAESTFTFAGEQGEPIDLVVRLADDGVAYRYDLGAGEHRVDDESGSWLFPADGDAWLQRTYQSNYEAEWIEATVAAGNGTTSVPYPMLAESGDAYVLLTESDLHGNYSGTHLSHPAGSLGYGIDLFENRAVTWTGEAPTPWRVAIIGDLQDVVESTLVDDLATPNLLADTSWVDPGISSWSWLTEPASPRNEDRLRDYVDLAARNGWEYVLLDEGWNAEWVPRMVRYAHSKGVDVIVWFHSRDLQTQAQRDEWLPRLVEWGVSGIKVDFMDTDSQAIHQWYDAIAADTAEHELMLNFHGSTLPRGLQRTWPHIMTYEGIRGAENGINAARQTIVPFTRNVVGSMDWTPVVFSRGTSNSSLAQQVAMGVVFESGWQHFADNPESYAAHPDAERFLQNIPAGPWDDTRLLSGEPGSSVVLARQFGDDWYIGGIRAGAGAPVEVRLDMLGPGKWITDILMDGADGSSVAVTTERHRRGDVLSVPTATNGGFTIIACRATANRDSCLEEPQTVPATTLELSGAPAEVEPGTTFDLHAAFTATEVEVRDVVLAPELPEGWTVEGDPVTVHKAAPGETVEGSWRVTVPESGVSGTVELPVVAAFSVRHRDFEHATQAEVWVTPPPLVGDNWLSDLLWDDVENGWGPVERDTSNGESGAGDGAPISIGGTVFAKGIGMHAEGGLTVWLGSRCEVFSSTVGIDDEVTGAGSVRFRVYGDGELLAETEVVTAEDGAVPLDVDVTGVDRLRLDLDDAGDGKNHDHADWADALVSCGTD